jgi:hypothetical protein
MPINTPGDLIQLTLKSAGVLGVGQSALAEDYNDAFDVLNGLLAQWSRRRWLIWHLIDTFVVADGSPSYTIGIAGGIVGDFAVPRPDRIEAAFVRLLVSSPANPVDIPLTVLQSREDYNRFPLKTLSTNFPSAIFYDSAFPIGQVFPFPIPRAGTVEIHLSIKETLTQFTSFTQAINMPPEYLEAIWTNLTVRLAPIYQYETRPEVVALAKASLATIRGANTQIPRLTMPRGLVSGRSGSGGFPAFGGGGGGGTETLADLNALLATLPTTLPGAHGVLWNNAGVLAIS